MAGVAVSENSLTEEQKGALNEALSRHLESALGEANEMLLEYVMVMVMNGKAMETIKAELIDLIGEQQAADLSEWLGTYIEREVLSVANDPKQQLRP